MSEPGNAFVEVLVPGIGQVNAARGALSHRCGDAMKSPHPRESAYRGDSGSV